MVTAQNSMKGKKEGKLILEISSWLWLTALGTQGSCCEVAGTSLHYASHICVRGCEITKGKTAGAMPLDLLMCEGGQKERV